MEVEKIFIDGPLILRPKVFADSRGHFFESYSARFFKEIGILQEFVQDNQSLSQKGTVRGLHFQAPPFAQGKLVRVVQGSVIDIAVDIRKGSPAYGKHYAIELTAENKTMFWIPEGFAHGFSTLENDTVFQYKCTGYYNKTSEGGLLWNDPDLAVNWGITDPIISDKDAGLPVLKDFQSPFNI